MDNDFSDSGSDGEEIEANWSQAEQSGGATANTESLSEAGGFTTLEELGPSVLTLQSLLPSFPSPPLMGCLGR